MTSTELRRLTVALSHVHNGRWGLRRNVVDLVYRHTMVDGLPWAPLGRHDVADAIETSPRHARGLLDDLVVAQGVLERAPGKGSRPSWYRFRDPMLWRRVPWCHEAPAGHID